MTSEFIGHVYATVAGAAITAKTEYLVKLARAEEGVYTLTTTEKHPFGSAEDLTYDLTHFVQGSALTAKVVRSSNLLITVYFFNSATGLAADPSQLTVSVYRIPAIYKSA